MKNNRRSVLKTILIVIPIVVFFMMAEFLPWWSFLVPVCMLGMIITLAGWDVPGFVTGFAGGCIAWAGVSIFFYLQSGSEAYDKVALLFYMPKLILLGIAGLIGGVLTGLALYTGKSVVHRRKIEL